MIAEALAFLREELGRYIVANQASDSGSNPLASSDIILGNVAALDNDTDGRLKDKVVIGLVNIEEESTLKNESWIIILRKTSRTIPAQ